MTEANILQLSRRTVEVGAIAEATMPQHPEIPFKAGDVIELGDITELAVFEEIIAPLVDPKYNPDVWARRPHVRDLIRPPKFNGRIGDIALTVIENPYENMLSATARGYAFYNNARNFKRTSDRAEEEVKHYMGFGLTASAISSGRGVIGQIVTELYYYPCHRGLIKAGTVEHRTLKSGEIRTYVSKSDRTCSRGPDMGETIRRVVAEPKLERAKFIELDETARRIGFATLRHSMMHPFIAPYTQ